MKTFEDKKLYKNCEHVIDIFHICWTFSLERYIVNHSQMIFKSFLPKNSINYDCILFLWQLRMVHPVTKSIICEYKPWVFDCPNWGLTIWLLVNLTENKTVWIDWRQDDQKNLVNCFFIVDWPKMRYTKCTFGLLTKKVPY